MTTPTTCPVCGCGTEEPRGWHDKRFHVLAARIAALESGRAGNSPISSESSRDLAPGWSRLDAECCCYWCPGGDDIHESGYFLADPGDAGGGGWGACERHAEKQGAFLPAPPAPAESPARKTPREFAHAAWGWTCPDGGHCQGCDDTTKAVEDGIRHERNCGNPVPEAAPLPHRTAPAESPGDGARGCGRNLFHLAPGRILHCGERTNGRILKLCSECSSAAWTDLGDISAVPPDRSVAMSCEKCRVRWRGCADVFECPRCGEGTPPWNTCDPAEDGVCETLHDSPPVAAAPSAEAKAGRCQSYSMDGVDQCIRPANHAERHLFNSAVPPEPDPAPDPQPAAAPAPDVHIAVGPEAIDEDLTLAERNGELPGQPGWKEKIEARKSKKTEPVTHETMRAALVGCVITGVKRRDVRSLIERYVRERDVVEAALREELESLSDRIRTVADEANGPHPVQSASDATTCIERALFEGRAENEKLRKARGDLTIAIGMHQNEVRALRAELVRVSRDLETQCGIADVLRGDVSKLRAELATLKAPAPTFVHCLGCGYARSRSPLCKTCKDMIDATYAARQAPAPGTGDRERAGLWLQHWGLPLTNVHSLTALLDATALPAVVEEWRDTPTMQREHIATWLKAQASAAEDGDDAPTSAYSIARRVLEGLAPKREGG